MELFKISTMNASKEKMTKLYEEINKELNHLHTQQYGYKINWIVDSAELKCNAILPQFQLQRDAEPIYEKVSSGLAEYVMNELEHEIIHQLIRREHQIYDHEEIASIRKYCIQMMNDEDIEAMGKDGRQYRKLKLTHAFRDYLSNHTSINIDGFIQFRLPEYKEDLLDVVEYAIDEFLMDKQYQEFISLLKYFVYVQDTKVSEVHIIHKEGNDFIILNEEFLPIEHKKMEDFVFDTLDKDMNYEDMIISSLISISPQKVYIHTRQSELQVIKTIQQIFENRTKICEECRVCEPVLDKYSLDR